MPQWKQKATTTLAALFFAALPASAAVAGDDAGLPAKAQVAAPSSQALVTVNGRPITRREVERSMRILLAQAPRKGELSAEALKQGEEAVLEQLTNSELLYQAAQKVEMKELDRLVEQQMAANRAKFQTEKAYQAALTAMQMTQKEAEEFTRRDIAINALIDRELGAKAQVSESEARDFYQQNADRYFTTPEGVRASHILVAVSQTAGAEEKQKARDKAEALLKRVKGGEDFAALAKAESNCPSSAKGGDLGRFGRGMMVPAFEEAAFSLKAGGVSEVVESPYGFHIIKVTERFPAKVEAFEQVKDKILEYLKREKIGRELPELIKGLRAKAKIDKIEKASAAGDKAAKPAGKPENGGKAGSGNG